MRNITLRKFFLRSRYSMMLCQRKFASFEIWKPDDFIRYPGRIDDTIIRIATAIYLYIYILIILKLRNSQRFVFFVPSNRRNLLIVSLKRKYKNFSTKKKKKWKERKNSKGISRSGIQFIVYFESFRANRVCSEKRKAEERGETIWNEFPRNNPRLYSPAPLPSNLLAG